MYSRPVRGRFPEDLHVPENYSGNAFREPPFAEETDFPPFVNDMRRQTGKPEAEKSEHHGKREPEDEDCGCRSRSQTCGNCSEVPCILPPRSDDCGKKKPFPSAGFKIDMAKFFNHGIGFEEILIIGLILLIAGGDNSDDILILLALLLFIG